MFSRRYEFGRGRVDQHQDSLPNCCQTCTRNLGISCDPTRLRPPSDPRPPPRSAARPLSSLRDDTSSRLRHPSRPSPRARLLRTSSPARPFPLRIRTTRCPPASGADRPAFADAASTTFASDNPNTRAVIRAMSTRETLSGPPMLNVLFSFDVSDASKPPRRRRQRDDVRGDVAQRDGHRHSSRKNVTVWSPRSAPRMKSKNKGRFTGRMGASAPVMMLLRSMACSSQPLANDRLRLRLGSRVRVDGSGGCVASTLMASSPPYTWSVLRWTRRGRRVPSSPADHAASRASRSAVGTLVASAEAGSRSHAAGELVAAQFTTKSARGAGAVGERSAPRAARTASRIPSPVMASARWPTCAGQVGVEGVVAIRVVARPPVHAGEHVHEVLAEVAAAAYDERATFRRHLDGKHRDRRRDVTDRGPRARSTPVLNTDDEDRAGCRGFVKRILHRGSRPSALGLLAVLFVPRTCRASPCRASPSPPRVLAWSRARLVVARIFASRARCRPPRAPRRRLRPERTRTVRRPPRSGSSARAPWRKRSRADSSPAGLPPSTPSRAATAATPSVSRAGAPERLPPRVQRRRPREQRRRLPRGQAAHPPRRPRRDRPTRPPRAPPPRLRRRRRLRGLHRSPSSPTRARVSAPSRDEPRPDPRRSRHAQHALSRGRRSLRRLRRLRLHTRGPRPRPPTDARRGDVRRGGGATDGRRRRGVSGSRPGVRVSIHRRWRDGGVAAGLPRATAQALAAQTVMGAAKMVLETGEHPGALKDKVCSPGGTTIRAVHARWSGAGSEPPSSTPCSPAPPGAQSWGGEREEVKRRRRTRERRRRRRTRRLRLRDGSGRARAPAPAPRVVS